VLKGARMPVPAGRCTCFPLAPEPCDYCHAMNLWAYDHLYGAEEEAMQERAGDLGDDPWDYDDCPETES